MLPAASLVKGCCCEAVTNLQTYPRPGAMINGASLPRSCQQPYDCWEQEVLKSIEEIYEGAKSHLQFHCHRH